MKIALVGPTGFVGSKVLDEASRRGHQITAISRHPERVPKLSGVRAIKADMLERKQATEAFAGHDVVVSCYNAGHHPTPGGNVFRDTIEGVVNIIKATKAADVRRLLFVGGGGSLYVAPGVQTIDGAEDLANGAVSGGDFPEELVMMMPPNFKYWDGMFSPDVKHEHVAPFVHALMFFEHDQTYDWSFFAPPPGLHPGPRLGGYTLGDNQCPMINGRFAGLSLADAAIALVDEIETPKHVRKHWTAYDPEVA